MSTESSEFFRCHFEFAGDAFVVVFLRGVFEVIVDGRCRSTHCVIDG
jgi:hypothetical protein